MVATDTETTAFRIRVYPLSFQRRDSGGRRGEGAACRGLALFGWRDDRYWLVPDSNRKRKKSKFYILGTANHSNKNEIYALKLLLKRNVLKAGKENSSFTLKGVERRVRNDKKQSIYKTRLLESNQISSALICEYVRSFYFREIFKLHF